MAFAAGSLWDSRATGSDSNGGGFDPTNANMATDLAATSGTGAAPVVTSASYTFVAGDVGHWVFVQSGTNWNPGWFQIASVAGGAATLNATTGQWITTASASTNWMVEPSTTQGVATVASPTGGVWSIDYSQTDAAGIAYTDMVIDGATNTIYTSAANPVDVNIIGNVINVTSGTGFTVQRVQVVSVSGTQATVDKSLGTLGSTGGNGNLGGSLLSPSIAGSLHVIGNDIYVKSGTYSMSTTADAAAGRVLIDANGTDADPNRLFGYGTLRGDNGTKPIFQASAGSVTLITASGAYTYIDNIEFRRNGQATTRGITHSGSNGFVRRCYFNDLGNSGIIMSGAAGIIFDCQANACNTNPAFEANTGSAIQMYYCVAVDGSGIGFNFSLTNGSSAYGCIAHNLSLEGFQGSTNADGLVWQNCIAEGITGDNDGFLMQGNGLCIDCIAYNCSDWGFNGAAKPLTNFLFNCAGGDNDSGNFDTADFTAEGFITLTANPFVDVAGNDFGLNNTAGGGGDLRNAGYQPDSYATVISTETAPSIGASQVEGGGLPAKYYVGRRLF